MTWKVEEYIAEDGRIPYRDWFDGLHVQAAAKVATVCGWRWATPPA